MFSGIYRNSTEKTGKYVKELSLSFPKLKTELKNSYWFVFCPPPKAGFPCSPRTKLWLGLYWEKPGVQALTSSSYSAAQTGLTGFRVSFVCCYCNLSGDV